MLFLLSAAPIGLGCVITGDDDTTAAETTTATTTATGGETETPTTMTTGMTSSATSDTTAGPADTTAGPADTTTGGSVIPEICTTYGDQISECYMDMRAGAAAAEYCAEVIAGYEKAYGADCVAAFEDFLACLSALTCDEFTGADPVCTEQSMALETACVGA